MLFSEPKIPQSVGAGAALSRFGVSVLFSEPKIPQFAIAALPFIDRCGVSVLFSEPKIPQSVRVSGGFWCVLGFQCSSASRKFLNPALREKAEELERVSVLFSEPKIPQSRLRLRHRRRGCRFSALQRAENSSIPV